MCVCACMHACVCECANISIQKYLVTPPIFARHLCNVNSHGTIPFRIAGVQINKMFRLERVYHDFLHYELLRLSLVPRLSSRFFMQYEELDENLGMRL